jgi:alginate O-acetyltransferase complex protein AlgI
MMAVLTHEREVVLFLAMTVVLLPRRFSLGRLMDSGRGPRIGALRLGYVLVAAPVCAILVAAGTFSPFLYYQF